MRGIDSHAQRAAPSAAVALVFICGCQEPSYSRERAIRQESIDWVFRLSESREATSERNLKALARTWRAAEAPREERLHATARLMDHYWWRAIDESPTSPEFRKRAAERCLGPREPMSEELWARLVY